jgi:hypothetical protein
MRITTSAQTYDGDLRVNSKKIFPGRSQMRWESVVLRFVDRRKDDVHFPEVSTVEWHSTVWIDI